MGSLRLIVAAAAMLVRALRLPRRRPMWGRLVGRHDSLLQRAPDQAWPVARAVYVWNHSGARIRFVPSPLASAQLVIKHYTHNRCVDHAQATVGYGPNATMWLPQIDETSGICNSYSSVHAVAHELGHVLGLGHEERGCALDERDRHRGVGAEALPAGSASGRGAAGLLEPDRHQRAVPALRRPREAPRAAAPVPRITTDPLHRVSLSVERRGRRVGRAALRCVPRLPGGCPLFSLWLSRAISAGGLGDRRTPAMRARTSLAGAKALLLERSGIGEQMADCRSAVPARPVLLRTLVHRPARSVRATGRRPPGSLF